MLLPKGATVAVADGEKLVLFRNAGDEREIRLEALPAAAVESDKNRSAGARRQSSAANPDENQGHRDRLRRRNGRRAEPQSPRRHHPPR